MSNYSLLPGGASPRVSAAPAQQTYATYYADSDDEVEAMRQPVRPAHATWWPWRRAEPPMPPPQSAYLTLIPLSDSRLKPQNTRLLVGTMLILAIASVCGVFFLVPRGVTVGSIQVHSSQISFNTSKSTYQIVLTATVPVFNPNYLPVRLSGTVNVSFYDQQAGFTVVQPVDVPARAQPQVINIDMDASSVPQKYLFTIYTQCFTFPEKLIFFLTGSLQAQYLGKTFYLPHIDNYVIVSCNQSDKPDQSPETPPAVPIASPTA